LGGRAEAVDRRTADREAARSGLATVDSLLQVDQAGQALALAESLWLRLGEVPVWGWQIEGRLGLVLLLDGRPDAALPHLENVVRQHPREAAHHRNLGAALLELDRRGRALSEYQVAVELDPMDPDLRREYGQLLLAFRDTRRAAVELQLARELCGGCPALDQPLASLYLLQGEFARAVPLLQRLYRHGPTPELRRSLVGAMAQAGHDSALVVLVAGWPPVDRSADEWHLLIEAEGRLGIWPESRCAVEALGTGAADLLPATVANDARFWGQVALNLLTGGEPAASLLAIEQAVTLAPENVVHLNNKVVILIRLGRDAEARSVWAKVQALDPSLAETDR
jgi:Flp pilus assembly protein TadD